MKRTTTTTKTMKELIITVGGHRVCSNRLQYCPSTSSSIIPSVLDSKNTSPSPPPPPRAYITPPPLLPSEIPLRKFTDQSLDPYTGILRCRLNTSLDHLPEKVSNLNCQLHWWQDKTQCRKQLMKCATCNVCLCIECYKTFHTTPNLIPLHYNKNTTFKWDYKATSVFLEPSLPPLKPSPLEPSPLEPSPPPPSSPESNCETLSMLTHDANQRNIRQKWTQEENLLMTLDQHDFSNATHSKEWKCSHVF